MNIKNNDNLTKMHLPTQKAVIFYPEPVERMGDKDLHRTIVYNENKNKSDHWSHVKKTFEDYADRVALCAGAKNLDKTWIETAYGLQLADGEVFVPLTLQPFTPMIGYIDPFAIETLYLNPYMGTIIYMKNGICISCSSRLTCVMEKIQRAQDFYDPDYRRHSKEGVPFSLSDASSAALMANIPLGNKGESDLIITNERELDFAYAFCNHINAMPPSQRDAKLEGLRKRLKFQKDQVENSKRIRAQGQAAENIIVPVSSANGIITG